MNDVKVGDINFKSWSEAKKYAKSILYKYNLEGETISDVDRDFFINSLMLREDKGIGKIGCGVKTIFLRYNNYGGKTLWIERIDGSQTDFSIYKPFSRKTNKTKLSQKDIDVRRAARTAVHNDIKKLKIERAQFGDAHHSEIEFEQIFKNWIKENGLNINSIEVNGHKDGDIEITFMNNDIERSFIDYHNKHAKIEVILPEEHRKLNKTLK